MESLERFSSGHEECSSALHGSQNFRVSSDGEWRQIAAALYSEWRLVISVNCPMVC